MRSILTVATLCSIFATTALTPHSVIAFEDKNAPTKDSIKDVSGGGYESFVAAYEKAIAAKDVSVAATQIDKAVNLAESDFGSDDQITLQLRLKRLALAAKQKGSRNFEWEAEARALPSTIEYKFGAFSNEHESAVIAASKAMRRHRWEPYGSEVLRKYVKAYANSDMATPAHLHDLYLELMKAFYFRGKGDKALKPLAKAEAALLESGADANGKEMAGLVFWRAKALMQQKKRNAAAEALEDAIKRFETLQPDSQTTLAAYATAVRLYERMRKPELATKYSQAIASVKPGTTDQGTSPIYRVKLQYPRKEAISRVEGYAIIEFDVDETGKVINPRTVETEGSEAFADASTTALQQFRYVPGFENGTAVRVEGLRYKFDFKLRRS